LERVVSLSDILNLGDVMDARNNEHENLELGAIFCHTDISALFSAKSGYFALIMF